jgi:hypothetical protein
MSATAAPAPATDHEPAVTWSWEWVPGRYHDPSRYADWTRRAGEAFGFWLARLKEESASVPAELTERSTQDLGRDLALAFLIRADQLPPHSYLLCGTVRVNELPVWTAVSAVAQLGPIEAADPDYLLDRTGARNGGRLTAPLDYVTTRCGDGFRFVLWQRASDDTLTAELRAAMRVEWPEIGSTPATRFDLVVTARTDDPALVAVVGPGVDRILEQVSELGLVDPGPVDARPVATRPVDARPVDARPVDARLVAPGSPPASAPED